DTELPPVVDAGQTVVLVASEEQRRTAMGTVRIENAHLARRVAESYKILTEQSQADGSAVGLRQLRGEERWKPIVAKDLAHRRALGYRGQDSVSLRTQHWRTACSIF